MTDTMWDWPNSTVRHVVDGDTQDYALTRMLEVEVPAQDLGFHATIGPVTLSIPMAFPQRLRLNRINCAAATTALGKQATAKVAALTTGVQLHIQTVSPYKYGDEWMAEVTLPDGSNVSDVLVAAGLAAYWNGQGPRPLGAHP